MITDFVELSMNLAGTAVGSAGTKTILAAISAGVNGINGSIDKDYFYEKTFLSLVAQMNADRKKVLVSIVKGMTLDETNYPWHTAVRDLISYYNAGTLFSAISSIQKDAGKKESEADGEIEMISPNRIASHSTLELFEQLIKSLKHIDSTNIITVNKMLPKLAETLPEIKSCSIEESNDVEKTKDDLKKCIFEAAPRQMDEKLRARNLKLIESQFNSAKILN